MSQPQDEAGRPNDEANVDAREQLVNDRETGPIHLVSLPEINITKLHGVMLDFDPGLYRADALPPGTLDSPPAMLQHLADPWLKRHPLLDRAQVRDSGRGLHAILRFAQPVKFESEGERDRWAAAVRVVQRSLPSDPCAPGITALTRPVGSINSKTGRVVSVLEEGTPLDPAEVLKYVEALRAKPFRLIAETLFGPRCSPCPICRKPGTTLGVQDRAGICYAGGHRVNLADLFDSLCVTPDMMKEVR
jgi:hypothetical protein